MLDIPPKFIHNINSWLWNIRRLKSSTRSWIFFFHHSSSHESHFSAKADGLFKEKGEEKKKRKTHLRRTWQSLKIPKPNTASLWPSIC